MSFIVSICFNSHETYCRMQLLELFHIAGQSWTETGSNKQPIAAGSIVSVVSYI